MFCYSDILLSARNIISDNLNRFSNIDIFNSLKVDNMYNSDIARLHAQKNVPIIIEIDSISK